MYCDKCGKQVDEKDKICKYCGKNIYRDTAMKENKVWSRVWIGGTPKSIVAFIIIFVVIMAVIIFSP